ncbi:KilA-N domain-containing protein [Pseudomonas alliivorans]|nr:KilA-N domain-containing protein [Pseudomonas alliivorans]
MNNIVLIDFEGSPVRFNADGWINATEASSRFNKEPAQWLRLPDATRYLKGLKRTYGKITYVKTSRARADRGGGTWIHPRLAVKFARWLSVDFEIWCDEQIDALLRGAPSALDRFNRARKKFDDRKLVASESGRNLNAWRREKPGLICEIERGRELLQMTLGLNKPAHSLGEQALA